MAIKNERIVTGTTWKKGLVDKQKEGFAVTGACQTAIAEMLKAIRQETPNLADIKFAVAEFRSGRIHGITPVNPETGLSFATKDTERALRLVRSGLHEIPETGLDRMQ